MNQDALRTLVRQKLADGRLPNNHIPRVWGGPGAGETCDACEEVVTKAQLIMEGITLSVGRESVQFHVMCFNVWDAERQVAGHDPSGLTRPPTQNPCASLGLERWSVQACAARPAG